MSEVAHPVKETVISEQKEFDGQLFPLALIADSKSVSSVDLSCEWLKNHKAYIADKLVQHGAILLRGFPLNDAQDFDKFVAAYGLEPLPYVGGAAPRRQITERVSTTNEAPPERQIPFHHEMAQVPTFPSVLFFFCDTPPTSGGQTPLALSNLVYQKMVVKHPQFVKDLEDKKIVYTRVLPDGDDNSSAIGRGWQSTFQTEDKDEAERRCLDQGTMFEWLPDGCMKTVTSPTVAIVQDARNGKKMWFNSITAAYYGWRDCRNPPGKSISFADGTPMSQEVVDDIMQIMDDIAVDITWQKGDVIIVDNKQVLHARRSFVPPRLILASLAK